MKTNKPITLVEAIADFLRTNPHVELKKVAGSNIFGDAAAELAVELCVFLNLNPSEPV